MHDGGGSRAGTVAAAKTVIQERLDDGWTFTLPAVTLAPSQPPGTAVISADFEDGLQGWVPRANDAGQRRPSRSPTPRRTAARSPRSLTERTVAGPRHRARRHRRARSRAPATSTPPGCKFARGPDRRRHLAEHGPHRRGHHVLRHPRASSRASRTAGGRRSPARSRWDAADVRAALLRDRRGTTATRHTSDFLVDDVVVKVQDPLQVQDLTPIKDTVDFPVGRGDRQPRDRPGPPRSCCSGTSTRSRPRTT